MGKEHHWRNLLKVLLEEHGFSVEFNGILRGFSGVDHTFDLIASKRKELLCFDLANPDVFSFLRCFSKAIDVRNARIFILVNECNRRMVPEGIVELEHLKLIVFKDLEDLVDKIRPLITGSTR
ncbi:MAG: hypothetical protein DRJ51_02685 [Thermoprotei archaeon]|nr:MAG: hypothetical protein DRJ51_02685 [Thermoprotei archaeon]RLF02832.1 MAG: hypothetical protein DRJ59_02475 [Thermoprotei archaeon]